MYKLINSERTSVDGNGQQSVGFESDAARGKRSAGVVETRLELEHWILRRWHCSQAVPGMDLSHFRIFCLHCKHAVPSFIVRSL